MSGCKTGNFLSLENHENLLLSLIEVASNEALRKNKKLLEKTGDLLIKISIGIGSEIYDKLNNFLETQVKKEIENTKIKINERFKKIKNGLISEVENISDIYFNITENTSKNVLKKFFQSLDNIIKTRQEYEQIYNLKPIFSKEILQIQQEIKNLKITEDVFYELKEKSKIIEKDLEKEIKKIEAKAELVKEYCWQEFEFVKKVIFKIKNTGKGLKILKKSREWKIINEVFNQLKDTKKREKLEEFIFLKNKFLNNPLLVKYTNIKEIEKVLNNYRDGILHDFSEEKLLKLKEDLNNYLKYAKEKYKQEEFEEIKTRVKKALKNKRYNFYVEHEDKNYYMIIAEGENDKKAKVSILKPGVEKKKLPEIKIEIDQDVFSSKEEWEKEGKSLAKELLSWGLNIKFEETMTHFKGKLLEEAVETLKKRLKNKVDVKIVVDNKIKIGDQEIIWSPGFSIEEIEQIIYQKQKNKEEYLYKPLETKDRLKEVEK